MSSQEEYLDNLLKDMMHGDRAQEEAPGNYHAVFSDISVDQVPPENELNEQADDLQQTAEASSGIDGQNNTGSYDIDAVKGMGIEDINRILEENAFQSQQDKERKQQYAPGLVELLERSGETELKTMIEKADRNEALDTSIVNMIKAAQAPEVPQSVLEEMGQLEGEKDEEKGIGQKLSGRLKHILGKKAEEAPSKRPGDFEYEQVELFEKIKELEDQEKEKKKQESFFGKLKKKLEDRKKAREEKKLAAEKEEKPSQKRKRKKHGMTLEQQLGNLTEQPEEENREADEAVNPLLEQEIPEDASDSSVENTVLPQEEAQNVPENTDPDQILTESEIAAVLNGDGQKAQETKQALASGSDADAVDLSGMDALLQTDELNTIREKEGDESSVLDVSGLTEGLSEDLFADVADLPDLGGEGNAADLLELADIKDKDADKKKKGLFARLLDFLTEEDEEEEKQGEGLILSDENNAILKELDEKGKKKKKDKKPKKGKGGQKAEGDEEEVPVKKEKKKKPKKEKAPKEKEPEEPGKRLSKRRVTLIFLICIALGGAFLVLSNVTIDFSEKRKASTAFREGDYEECYQNLVGKNLSESEQVMFGKSESILRIRLWKREYEMLAEEGQEPEALDSLLQSVHDYPKLYSYSGKWNATSEVQEIYDQLLAILLSKYRLTEEQAKTIANEPDDLIYSQLVRRIAGGGSYDDGIETEPSSVEIQEPVIEDPNRDLLPEEEGLGNVRFSD